MRLSALETGNGMGNEIGDEIGNKIGMVPLGNTMTNRSPYRTDNSVRRARIVPQTEFRTSVVSLVVCRGKFCASSPAFRQHEGEELRPRFVALLTREIGERARGKET